MKQRVKLCKVKILLSIIYVKIEYSAERIKTHSYPLLEAKRRSLPLLNISLPALERHDYWGDSVSVTTTRKVYILFFYLQSSLDPQKHAGLLWCMAISYQSIHLSVSTKHYRTLRSLLIRKETFCIDIYFVFSRI